LATARKPLAISRHEELDNLNSLSRMSTCLAITAAPTNDLPAQCLCLCLVIRLQLQKVDLVTRLRNLGAQLTQSPTELVPVKPIIEFHIVDKRFVNRADVLSDLESRPNIMDLNPFEFENLVSNLSGKMGLESKLTRSSGDGEMDVVPFDNSPVLGGKVVIQAKRYRHTVGASAVRDLSEP
jgi:restriction system protein